MRLLDDIGSFQQGSAPNVEIKVAERVENREDSGGGLGGGMTAVTFEGQTARVSASPS
jgi:hypothetical protein